MIVPMTVLAGLWRFSGTDDPPGPAGPVAAMIDAQLGGAGGRPLLRVDGAATIGRNWLPDDGRADPPPADAPILVADARVDNRGELFDKLSRRYDPALSDETLIALAYRQWGERIVDHLLGDFAIAAWDPGQQALTLIRDPTGQRPLHYHRDGNRVAFASLPQGLFGLGLPRTVDTARLAGFVADVPANGLETFFAGIARVEPAQIVRIDRDGVRTRRYWDLPAKELRLRNDVDYVEALREQLDRSTRARLRGAGALVAAHLSAGLDSGAVAATAARLLAPEGDRVLAITSAPREGFAGPVPRGRIADESEAAAEVAALYPNMEQLVLRPAGASALDHLDEDSRLFGQPVGFPCNNVWWRDANAAAQARGATVMLTGELGNLSLSAGGLPVLAEFVRRGELLTWLRALVALRRNGPRWRGLFAASFAPWIPARLWDLLTGLSAGGRSDAPDQLSRTAPARAGKPDPRQRERDLRWSLLKLSDPGSFRKGALLHWGVDERDPTADRRLIEFCFSLPPAQLLGGGRTRRLARAALADRLPASILNGVRGYQYADWYESLDRPALTAFAARVAASPAAGAAIDFAAVDRLIAGWPPNDWASARTIGTYRIGLLRALAAGAFALNAGA